MRTKITRPLSVLFITRKYPPSVGGMQQVSYKLATNLACAARVRLLAWGHSQVFLPLIIPWLAARAIAALLRRKSDVIYIGDPVLSPLGTLLKRLFGIPVVVTVHGRDVAFSNRIYQRFLPRFLNDMDCVVCVSDHICRECVRRGVRETSCTVIPNGVDVDDFALKSSQDRAWQDRITSRFRLTDRMILLTVGRLVEKKGIHYFIKEILPRILARMDNVTYVVVGDGPWRSRIEALIKQHGLESNVLMIGKLPMNSPELRAFYQLADLFIMPNIQVRGDIEGFGIVALEACAAGCWVAASKVDGIEDAVIDGENGSLVEPGDVEKYAETVLRLLADEELKRHLGHKAQEFVARHYNWKLIASRYYKVLTRVADLR